MQISPDKQPLQRMEFAHFTFCCHLYNYDPFMLPQHIESGSMNTLSC